MLTAPAQKDGFACTLLAVRFKGEQLFVTNCACPALRALESRYHAGPPGPDAQESVHPVPACPQMVDVGATYSLSDAFHVSV